MEHKQYLELMSAALDGEITPAERQTLEAHLAVCPECAALWKKLREESAALRDLDCQVPEGLKARILADLPPQKTPRPSPWRRWAAACACLVLVAAALTAPRLLGKGDGPLIGSATLESAAPESPAESESKNSADSPDNFQINRLPDGYFEPSACQKWSFISGIESSTAFDAVRLDGEDESMPADGVHLLDSREALEDFLAQLPAGDSQDLAGPARSYDSAYFTGGKLAAIVLTDAGGRQPVLLELTARQAVIGFTQDERGGDEPAHWVLLIPVDGSFSADGDIQLVYSEP